MVLIGEDDARLARIVQYGFVLAMPAAMLMTVAALDWVPGFISRRGGYGGIFAAAALSLISVIIVCYLHENWCFIGLKTLKVGTGANAFWADPPRADAVNVMVKQILCRASPHTTLAVIPEGAFINCITGLRNPTPYVNMASVERRLYGEERESSSPFARTPPI